VRPLGGVAELQVNGVCMPELEVGCQVVVLQFKCGAEGVVDRGGMVVD